MAATDPDTVAAVATPPGRGGVGMVRVSGPEVPRLARALLGRLPAPRRAEFRAFRDAEGGAIDRGLALYFPAPRSYTGEDVLELHAHGSPAVLDTLVQRLIALGARPARPGEFSERAFLNDRLDLAQAEAVADLIDAGTRQAAAAAARSLDGAFSREVQVLVTALIELRAYVEAAIDFPDEDVDFLAEGDVLARVDALRESLAALRVRAGRGAVMREGLRLAIAGAPNVGKSSLLNRLSRRDSAIVTEIPGTTRDVLREVIDLDGLPVHVADTAGLRATGDPVEAEGVRRARSEIERADHILLLVDDRDSGFTYPDGVDAHTCLVVRNKCDLSGRPPGPSEDGLRVSATTGDGLDSLVAALRQAVGLGGGEADFSARRRHLDALDSAARALDDGRGQLRHNAAGELLAEDLRNAQDALGTITGTFTSEDLLGEIFAGFCIGK